MKLATLNQMCLVSIIVKGNILCCVVVFLALTSLLIGVYIKLRQILKNEHNMYVEEIK